MIEKILLLFLSITLSGLVLNVFNNFYFLAWLELTIVFFIILFFFFKRINEPKLKLTRLGMIFLVFFIMLGAFQLIWREDKRALNYDSALFVKVSEELAMNEKMPKSFMEFNYNEVNHNPLVFFIGGFFLNAFFFLPTWIVLFIVNSLILLLFFAIVSTWCNNLKISIWHYVGLLLMNAIVVLNIANYTREYFLLLFVTLFFFSIFKHWNNLKSNYYLHFACIAALMAILTNNRGFALLPFLIIYLFAKKQLKYLLWLSPILLFYLADYLRFGWIELGFFQFLPGKVDNVMFGFWFWGTLLFWVALGVVISYLIFKRKELKEKWVFWFSAYLLILFVYLFFTSNPFYYVFCFYGLAVLIACYLLKKISFFKNNDFKLLFFGLYFVWLWAIFETKGWLFNIS